jgi:hypothetical protein
VKFPIRCQSEWQYNHVDSLGYLFDAFHRLTLLLDPLSDLHSDL